MKANRDDQPYPPSGCRLARSRPGRAGFRPADADLVPALVRAFPGFEFSVARIDDDSRHDSRSVIRPDRNARAVLRWADKPCGV